MRSERSKFEKRQREALFGYECGSWKVEKKERKGNERERRKGYPMED